MLRPPVLVLLLLLAALVATALAEEGDSSNGAAVAAAESQLTDADAVVNEFHQKLEALRGAYNVKALSLEAYFSAASAGLRAAEERRPWVAIASRRMQDALIPTGMSGKNITIVTMEDSPFVTRTSVAGRPLAYAGFCIDMLAEIAQLANFTYSFVPRATAQLDNGWNGAVNDVADGATDMFWSDFFLTAQRAAIVDVTASWLDTGLVVIGLADLSGTNKDDGYGGHGSAWGYLTNAVAAPFSPFSPGLWQATCLAMLGYAGIMYILERPTDIAKLSEDERMDLPTGLHGLAAGMFNELYITATGVRGPGREPDTSFGKMLLAIMSFFTLVATSMYTANLATQLLISAQSVSRYTGLADVIDNGEKVCVTGGTSTFGMLQRSFPAATLVPVANKDDGLSKLRSGVCGGYVGPEYQGIYITNQADFCDLKVLGGIFNPLNFIYGATKNSPNVHTGTLSYWITHLRESGFHSALLEKYFLSVNQCGSESTVSEDSLKIHFDSMAGVFLVLGASCVTILGFWVFDIMQHRAFLQLLWARVDADGSGTLDEDEAKSLLLLVGLTMHSSADDPKTLNEHLHDMTSYTDEPGVRFAEFSQWWDAQPHSLRVKLFQSRKDSATADTGVVANPMVDSENLSEKE